MLSYDERDRIVKEELMSYYEICDGEYDIEQAIERVLLDYMTKSEFANWLKVRVPSQPYKGN